MLTFKVMFLGNSIFEVVGVAFLTKSGSMVKTELNDLPFTTFTHNIYNYTKDILAVCNGQRKNATTYMLKPKERLQSCEAHTS